MLHTVTTLAEYVKSRHTAIKGFDRLHRLARIPVVQEARPVDAHRMGLVAGRVLRTRCRTTSRRGQDCCGPDSVRVWYWDDVT